MNIDFEFACQDDCLDKIVPSDLRKLVAERDALAAQVEQLSILCLAYENKLPFPVMTSELFEPVFKAQTLLAEIKAEAGLVGYFRGTDDAWRDLTGGPSPEQMTAHRATEYSNQVRQGGDK